MNPFRILEIPEDSDDKTIREAYFRLIKVFPPDREPEGFARIRKAYELIRDPEARIAARLGWSIPPSPLEFFPEDKSDVRNFCGPQPWLKLIASLRKGKK